MQPADDKLRKRKKNISIGGEKKIDTFRSPTKELVLDASYFVDKTRKAAGQLEQEHIFLFESAALNFFIVPFFCHVKSSKLFDVSF